MSGKLKIKYLIIKLISNLNIFQNQLKLKYQNTMMIFIRYLEYLKSGKKEFVSKKFF